MEDDSSVESQKGISAVKPDSAENQKGAITVKMSIAPFWFSMKHGYPAFTPFWFSADNIIVPIFQFVWFSSPYSVWFQRNWT